MKKFVTLCILPIVLMAAPAKAEKVEFKILDRWDCAHVVCNVAIDPNGNIVFILSDKDGIMMIFHRGKVVYKREGV